MFFSPLFLIPAKQTKSKDTAPTTPATQCTCMAYCTNMAAFLHESNTSRFSACEWCIFIQNETRLTNIFPTSYHSNRIKHFRKTNKRIILERKSFIFYCSLLFEMDVLPSTVCCAVPLCLDSCVLQETLNIHTRPSCRTHRVC